MEKLVKVWNPRSPWGPETCMVGGAHTWPNGQEVGMGLTLRVDADLVDGAFSIHEGVLAPGETIPPPHVHETADQLLYVISGSVTATVDGVTVHASAGDFVHKPKGKPHTFTNPSDKRRPCSRSLRPTSSSSSPEQQRR